MEGQQYDPVKAAQVYTHPLCRFISCLEPASCKLSLQEYPLVILQYAKQLADDLREKIKALGYDRHKLVVQARMPH